MDGQHSVVAWLCSELPSLRRLAARHGLSEQLETVVARARGGGELRPSLDELLRALGVPGLMAGREIVELPGLGPAHPGGTADLYVCPTAACARSWVRAPGVDIPACSLQGGLLVLRRRA